MASLANKFEIETTQPENLFKKEDSAGQLARNMYHIYFKLAQMIGEYFSEEWFCLHGSLLPTNNGHNCNLTSEEYQILNKFIRDSF